MTDVLQSAYAGSGNVGQAVREPDDLRAAAPPTAVELPAPPDSHPSVDLLGVRFSAWSEQQLISHVMAQVDGPGARRGGWIVTPNVDILRKLAADAGLRELLGAATVIVPDGMPLLWAAALQRTPMPERVTGASLLETMSAAAAARGRSVYLLGGAEGVAEQAALRLADRNPGLRVAGWSPPFRPQLSVDDIDEMRVRLLAHEPDLVFCGFGFPKQERVIAALVEDFPHTWFVGCGASLTFAAGRIPRAPAWMQRSGLEWLHRLSCEPRRMFRRYVVDDLPFAVRMLAVAAGRRFQRSARPAAVTSGDAAG